MPRYIDADAFIKEQCNSCDGYCEKVECDCLSCDKPYQCDMIQDLKAAPTVSPDEVRGAGEWEQKEIINLEYTTIEQMQSACCSVCGKYHTTPFSYYFTKYNYCPHCGARMKGAEDETTDDSQL